MGGSGSSGAGTDCTLPDGELFLDRSEGLPDSREVLPDKGEVSADRIEVLPDRSGVSPDSREVLPDRIEVLPDRSEVLPDSGEVLPDRAGHHGRQTVVTHHLVSPSSSSAGNGVSSTRATPMRTSKRGTRTMG